MSKTTCQCTSSCTIEYGKCHCGCGRETTIAATNNKSRNWIKGEPVRYIRGHATLERGVNHTLTEMDVRNRRAICSRCGLVTIKQDSGRWKCTRQLSTEHRLYEINTDTQRGWCTGCCAEVALIGISRTNAPIRWKCLVNHRAQQTHDRTEHKERRKITLKTWNEKNGRNRRLLKRYGLTPEAYAAKLAEQNGGCAICHALPPEGEFLHVDHCHESNVLRDLLCLRCNRGLGLFGDDPDIIRAALDYTLRWRQKINA